jgi:Regulator of G protein signaling domain
MEEMCQQIFKTYFSTDSVKEINIDQKVKNVINNELKSENFYPEIWKPAFEITSNLLRVNHLPKFLKQSPSQNFKNSSTSVNGNIKPSPSMNLKPAPSLTISRSMSMKFKSSTSMNLKGLGL